MTANLAFQIAPVLSISSFTEDAVLIKHAAGTRTQRGRFVEGAESQTDILVTSAPMSGSQRDLLPEGLRELESRMFWTTANAESIVAGESDGDFIRYDNTDYQIIMLDEWGAFRQMSTVKPEAAPADI